ncbi:MAG: carbamoyltransferase HypF [Thermoanaerobaculia bacterium]|nr:carbamoyltransferase HypF [Thermoanaerobaculia bacterium]
MPPPVPAVSAVRRRLAVTGIVQGVGFRPFVHGLATRLGLAGRVCNLPGGVEIEIEGPAEAVAEFGRRLRSSPPPLAVLDAVVETEMVLAEPPGAGFEIVETRHGGDAVTPISPDVATCDDCLRELFDPADRRYRYPFLNCTHCGPRFTIIEDVPYDRAATTMRVFPMCPACAAEYHDPSNRRFHAQPTACPECGPRLTWSPGPEPPTSFQEAALAAALAALDAGQVVAIKGLGGFHLACDARAELAVARLRHRKGRGDKPFAVMVPNLDTARRYARVDEAEARLLSSRARPIVLLEARAAGLAPSVAPGQNTIGLLLPYTPLHHLLFEGPRAARPLVMTSGNRSEEPIVIDDAEAHARLACLADGFLGHDRPIHVPCDDSVLRVVDGRELPLRRSRGYAPFPLTLPAGEAGEVEPPSVLAVGGELKATFCLTRGRRAFLSQHLGDQEGLLTQQAFERALDHLLRLFRVTPEVVVADLHPGYASGRLAARWAAQRGLSVQRVQHHHAHVAALMAELGLTAPVLGLAFDGTGHGSDGASWGGELLVADYRGFERLAHLRYSPQPGGDAAVRRPARMAFAHLHAAGLPLARAAKYLEKAEQRVLERQLETGFGAAPTSSFGRLFDSVAALLGLRTEVSFEGQAAMALEAIASDAAEGAYAFELDDSRPVAVLEPRPVLAAILGDLERGVPAFVISARFHAAVAAAGVELARLGQSRTGLGQVALTGGVFQNVRLLRATVAGLAAAGFEPLVHRLVPPNDGGLALGQAAIAALEAQPAIAAVGDRPVIGARGTEDVP